MSDTKIIQVLRVVQMIQYLSFGKCSIIFNETFYFTATINMVKETWIQGDSDLHNENIVRIHFTKIHCNCLNCLWWWVNEVANSSA